MTEFPAIGERTSYPVAGKAQRQAQARARAVREPKLSRADVLVLGAVLDLTTSFSKLSDRVGVATIARLAGLSARQVRRSLARLAGAGVIVHVAGRGSGNLTLIGVPPAGEKADSYLATLEGADLAAFRPSPQPEKGTESLPKSGQDPLARENEKREVEAERLSEEGPVEQEPSRRGQDHALGKGTPRMTAPDRLLAGVEAANGRRDRADLRETIGRAQRAQEAEPARFVIEPGDAEAEAALLSEVEQLVAEDVLVEVERRPC